jgi:hypothetical protein
MSLEDQGQRQHIEVSEPGELVEIYCFSVRSPKGMEWRGQRDWASRQPAAFVSSLYPFIPAHRSLV